MLLGEYQHTIDDKGRMAVPAKFRKSLSGGVVVTKGSEGCLYLFAVEEWTKLADKLSHQPITQADARAFSRLMLGGASHAAIASQGRVLIPEYLRKHAGIGARAVVVGLYNRAELWAEEQWVKYRESVERRTDEIAERMGELGI